MLTITESSFLGGPSSNLNGYQPPRFGEGKTINHQVFFCDGANALEAFFFLTFLAETRLARDGNCYDYDRFSSAQRKKNEPRDNKARLIGRTNCISLLASLLGSATTLVVAFRNRKNLLLLLILLVFFMNPIVGALKIHQFRQARPSIRCTSYIY